jgi:SAM-dependent methyltransferase
VSSLKLLERLYRQQGKHANYQALAPSLRALIGKEFSGGPSRYEAERLSYLCEKIEFIGTNNLDIGANTGYFSLALLERRARSVTAYEGNEAHARFLFVAGQALNYSEKQLRVINRYFESVADLPAERPFDVTFLLNVLHHLGDDYGNPMLNKAQFFQKTEQVIQSLATMTRRLVLQLGYCWKGNRNLLLFPQGSKQNQIDFIGNCGKDFWSIESVGITQKVQDKIIYEDMSSKNIARDDALGEFLNRPIFILRSRLI